jgi:hypothetical protein
VGRLEAATDLTNGGVIVETVPHHLDLRVLW